MVLSSWCFPLSTGLVVGQDSSRAWGSWSCSWFVLWLCREGQRAAVGVGFSETPMVCVFDKMLFVGWAGTFRGGCRATRVPCGGHQDGSQAVGLGRGPSPFPWQGSGALAELLLRGGSCWDRRAGVTCWALAPGCAPCFLSRLPATEPLKIPNKAWLN